MSIPKRSRCFLITRYTDRVTFGYTLRTFPVNSGTPFLLLKSVCLTIRIANSTQEQQGQQEMPPKTPPKTQAAKRRPKLKWRARDSQNSQLYNLQLDVNDLQQEIQQLEQLRSILRLQTRLNRMDDRDGSYVKVVREYHRVFRHGFQPVVAIEADSDVSSSSSWAPRVVDTMEFLSRVMDESVSIGRFVGLDMMRDQWTRYSAALANLDLRHVSSTVLPQMDYVAPGGDVRPVAMVSSEATYESTFTLDTMQLMFPQALKRHRSVVEKLLGRKFGGIAHFDFVFDTNTHRVIGYDFRVDLFAAFARLLHDPEDLCLLFDGAMISEESLIGDLRVYKQSPGSPTTVRRLEDSNQQQQHRQQWQALEQQRGWPRSTATVMPLEDGTDQPLPELHSSLPTEHTTWHKRAVTDPVVLRYATLRNDEEKRQRTRQLHSKLTNILDPADRVVPEPAETTTELVQSQSQHQEDQQDQQQPSESSESKPWQLKIANLLAAAEQEEEDTEETDGFSSRSSQANAFEITQLRSSTSSSSQVRLPSVSYFSAPALGSNNNHQLSSSTLPSASKKRANPFAPVDLLP